ncbi:unnamed protein product, partial [Adineta steineri]
MDRTTLEIPTCHDHIRSVIFSHLIPIVPSDDSFRTSNLQHQQRPQPLQQQKSPSSRPLLVLRSPTLLAPHRLLVQQRLTRVPLPQLRRQPQQQAPQPQKLLAQHPVPVQQRLKLQAQHPLRVLPLLKQPALQQPLVLPQPQLHPLRVPPQLQQLAP